MKTIKFEEKKIIIKGIDMVEVFTTSKPIDWEGFIQYINYGGRTFYLTQVNHIL